MRGRGVHTDDNAPLLTGLLGADVVSESGWSHGKVYDVRVADDDGAVVGLVVGQKGLAERLLGERRSRPGQVTRAWPVLHWEDVLRVVGTIVVVRDGAIPDSSRRRRTRDELARP
jgi:sporulation protein YlmC with PRC-barrel domain